MMENGQVFLGICSNWFQIQEPQDRERDTKEAEKLYRLAIEKKIQLKYKEAGELFTKASEQHLKSRDYYEAGKCLEEAHKMFKNCQDARYYTVLQEAAQLFMKTENSTDRAARLYETLAKEDLVQMQPHESLLHLKKAKQAFDVTLDGRSWFICCQIANTLGLLGRYDEAIVEFDKLIQEGVRNGSTHYVLAVHLFSKLCCYLFKQDWTQLSQKYVECYDLYPTFCNSREILFIALLLEHHREMNLLGLLDAIKTFKSRFYGEQWIQSGLEMLYHELESNELSIL
ncbi:soluble NSF attachment protein [Gorgonomyces haynaldii]|nr:soluble NSF attachment protein [Gorgonomyces haynaldii]